MQQHDNLDPIFLTNSRNLCETCGPKSFLNSSREKMPFVSCLFTASWRETARDTRQEKSVSRESEKGWKLGLHTFRVLASHQLLVASRESSGAGLRSLSFLGRVREVKNIFSAVCSCFSLSSVISLPISPLHLHSSFLIHKLGQSQVWPVLRVKIILMVTSDHQCCGF